MQKLLLLLLLVLSAQPAFAQDTLFTDNDRYLTGHVPQREHRFFVYYYTVSGSDTVQHRIRSLHVIQIAYADGTYWHPTTALRMAKLRKLSRPGEHYKPVGYPWVITANGPVYNRIAGLPGISLGMELTRFVDKDSRYSVSLAAYRMWAGTLLNREPMRGDRSANIQSVFVVPGVLYHPYGNKGYVDLGIGISAVLGSFTRRDRHYLSTSVVEHSRPATHILAAAMLVANLRIQPKQLALDIFASYGPMLKVGNTSGGFGQAGVKIGIRF